MSTQPDRYLRADQVCELVGFSRQTIWRMVRQGKFPKPVQPTGSRSIRWSARAVARWQEEKEGATSAPSVAAPTS